MARDTTPPASAPDEVEDPLAADRRTLAIGAISMAALVGVGVVSAQLFVTGGCGSFGEVRAADAEVVDVASVVDVEELAELTAAFDTGFTAAVVVPGDATGLTLLPDGVAVTGDTVTALTDPTTVRAELGVPGTIVGDGATLFDVALANELTGQIDSFTPVDGATLEPGDCTDTAVVSEQFAFLLDARDGQLLQLRIDEDGDEPVVELRDGDGIVSELELELPAGPAGVLGERLSGVIADDVVVTGRRVTADDPGAAVIVADAATGERRLEVDRDELVTAIAGTLPGPADVDEDEDVSLAVDALAVVDGQALLGVRPDPGPGSGDDAAPAAATAVVTLDLDDGTLAASSAAPGRAYGGAAGDDGSVAIGLRADGDDVEEVDVLILADGSFTATGLPGTPRVLRAGGDVPVLVTSRGYGILRPGEPVLVEDPTVDVRDVLQVGEAVLVLVHVDGRSVLLSG